MQLPVNIPVNIAIKLAQSDHNCLLVDLDTKRNAIQKVFCDDMSAITDSPVKAVETCIKNVSFLEGNIPSDLKTLIAEQSTSFSHIVIYAPNLNESMEKFNLSKTTRSAIIFTNKNEPEELEDAKSDLKNDGVKIINIKNI